MTKTQKIFIFLLRVSLGWLFLYSGITKVLDPHWSVGFYINSAKTFPAFYHLFAGPQILPFVSALNAWAQVALGMSLILGIFVRLSSVLGTALMALYYFPILDFPYPNTNSFIVDDHFIYGLVLLVLGAIQAGRVWGLDAWCANLPICSRFLKVRNWLG